MMPSIDEAMDTAFRDADRIVLEHRQPAPPGQSARSPSGRPDRQRDWAGSEYARRKAAGWIAVARSAVELYGDDPAVAFEELADELGARSPCSRSSAPGSPPRDRAGGGLSEVDEHQVARSLPGVGIIGGPLLVAAMGRPGRFARAASFRRFTGLTPRASETGESDAKGEAMSKAGSNWLRDQLVQSANTARQVDPDLARVYYVQMVERGAHHNKALCVVAAHLADRAWVTLLRQELYVLRDLDGNPISVAEGKAIVAEHFTVPEEVAAADGRRRRRGRPLKEVLEARSGRLTERRQTSNLPLRPASSSASTPSRRPLVTT